MATPQPVEVTSRLVPPQRGLNVQTIIDPPSILHFEHFTGYSASVASRLVWLDLAASPWWLTDAATGYGSGAYGAGTYGEAAGVGDYGALRYGRGNYGTGGYT